MLSMGALATELRVAVTASYYHLDNKEKLLDDGAHDGCCHSFAAAGPARPETALLELCHLKTLPCRRSPPVHSNGQPESSASSQTSHVGMGGVVSGHIQRMKNVPCRSPAVLTQSRPGTFGS
jgi:hypothetical protein